MALPWVRKYTPSSSNEIVGQEKAIVALRSYLQGYRRGMKPLLLYGPTGVGKTATALALAGELDLEVVELNASDARNKEAINSLLGAALGQRSLFSKGKVILVDEVDGVSGNADRGGVPALAALLKDAAFPVLLTANEIDDRRLKPLKKACRPVQFEPLTPAQVRTLLARVAEAESVEVEDEAMALLARQSGGDCRAAINDIQCISGSGKVTATDVRALGDREQKEEMQHALLRVLKSTNAELALPAFDNVGLDVDKLLLWLDENVPREYTRMTDLAKAYDALGEADRYNGRIRRWQYYRFYVYIYTLLTAGVALAKGQKYPGAQQYREPGRLLSLWIMNQKNAKRKAIAEKWAGRTHISAARAFQEFPLLAPLWNSGSNAAIAEELGLTDEEASWLS